MAIPAFASPAGDNVVINEVYARGGSANAPYTHKFVELYNPTDAAIDLSGMSLQYFASRGTNASRWEPLSGSIAANGYYLVAVGSNGSNGAALPTPDLDVDLGVSGTNGTVALVNGTDRLTVTNPLNTADDERFVDVVGFGDAGISETYPATYSGQNRDQGSIHRTDAVDTDDNRTDFEYSLTVTPQNSGGEGGDPVDPDPTDPDPVDPDPVDPSDIVPIADIQGTGSATPLNGQRVTTRGVVTANYPVGNFNGFYIQTPGTGTEASDASHGIFVYMGRAADVTIGDYVEVTGTAGEYNGLTQLSSSPTFRVLDEEVEAPVAYALTEADILGDKERFEGMLVDASGLTLTVTDNYSTNRYGQVGLAVGDEPLWQESDVYSPVTQRAEYLALVESNAARLITLDDGSSWDYTTNNTAKNTYKLPYLTTGENATRVGAKVETIEPMILDYRFQWNLQPTEMVTGDNYENFVTFENTRQAAPEVPGNISIASFNVLNYFTAFGDQYPGQAYTDREGNPLTYRSGNPRGAYTQVSFERQQGKIVAAINELDADVVGLEEIETSSRFGKDRDQALAHLVSELNAAGGNWDYAPSPAAVPGGNSEDVIRLAFIFNPDKVSLDGASKILLGDGAFENAREPLAQQWKVNGTDTTFVTITNHFKSKGSGADDGTGQGNANPDRIAQAKSLVAFAEREYAGEPIFLMGDFNSYTAEQPLDVLEDAGYTNLVLDAGHGEYTYTFGQRVGSLDHIFANQAAYEFVTDARVWSINSDEAIALEYSRHNYNVADLFEPNSPFRSSDHDPVKVGLQIGDTVEVDKSDLEAAIGEGQAAETEGMTEESVAALTEAIAAGEAVFANEDATQDEVDAAAAAIRDAIGNLEVIPVDKSDLEAAIGEGQAAETEGMTEESVAALTEAIAAGEAVFANEDATQDEVDAAAAAIRDAIGNLEVIPVDKSDLEAAIGEGEGAFTDNRTAESVAALNQAIAAGEAVFANEDATQDEVDAAAAAIRAAIAGLTVKPAPEKGNLFYIANDWVSTIAHEVIAYGREGDEVIIGDWDGDGRDTVGVRRGNTYYLKNTIDTGDADIEFTFGKATDEIIVGDWNGDGKDTIGVRRGNIVFLSNSFEGGYADVSYDYGRATDEVLAGDFDGDGKDTVALRRGNTLYVSNSQTGGSADVSFKYGLASDVMYAGDWDGDGKDTFAFRRGNIFYIKNTLAGGREDALLPYGRVTDTPYVGDWDGNGTDTPAVNRFVK